MPNIGNNTEAIIPLGTLTTVSGSPALALTIPDDATGIIFSVTVNNGTFTLDGVTVPAVGVGIATRLSIVTLHLYPGAPIGIFTTGSVNYQFFRTGDTYSLTSRT